MTLSWARLANVWVFANVDGDRCWLARRKWKLPVSIFILYFAAVTPPRATAAGSSSSVPIVGSNRPFESIVLTKGDGS